MFPPLIKITEILRGFVTFLSTALEPLEVAHLISFETVLTSATKILPAVIFQQDAMVLIQLVQGEQDTLCYSGNH